MSKKKKVQPTPAYRWEEKETFGTKIKAIRIAKNWTQTELAKRSGVPQGQISRLETSVGIPRLDIAQKLVAALGISLQ